MAERKCNICPLAATCELFEEDGDCRKTFSLVQTKELTPEVYKNAMEGIFFALVERTHYMVEVEKASGVSTTAVDKAVDTLTKFVDGLKNDDSITITAKGKGTGLLTKLLGGN